MAIEAKDTVQYKSCSACWDTSPWNILRLHSTPRTFCDNALLERSPRVDSDSSRYLERNPKESR